MNTKEENLHVLHDIRKMMERSSRFISLSGWSGISAGLCGLVGTWAAHRRIQEYYSAYSADSCVTCLRNDLVWIAVIVFAVAFVSAFLFTFLKTKTEGVAIWGIAARKLLWNTLLPMLAGGFMIWRMTDLKQYEFIPAACLIFYGLGLVNGSKYTMGEVRFLGYAEIITGIIGLFILRSGLYCWAFGFGVLHIIYGAAMWWKYDRKP